MLSIYGGGFQQAIFQVSVVYYAASIALHWIGPWLLPVKSIQVQQRQEGQVAREAIYSLGPIVVKAAVLTAVEKLHAAGVSKLYSGSLDSWQKILYVLVTIIVLDYLHDAWFYWTHRMLHSRFLYKHVHHLHHKSVAPTAFTGYSFHVVEAAIVFANEILVCFLFPIHIGVHRVYHLFTTVIHNGGHAGYEIAPFIPSMESLLFGALSWVQPAWNLCGGLNTVRHHDMHHRYPTRHFSLYFTHWDRWCGTQHVDYITQVRAMFKQAFTPHPYKTGLRRIHLDGTEEDLPFGYPPKYPPGYWAKEEAAYYAKYPDSNLRRMPTSSGVVACVDA